MTRPSSGIPHSSPHLFRSDSFATRSKSRKLLKYPFHSGTNASNSPRRGNLLLQATSTQYQNKTSPAPDICQRPSALGPSPSFAQISSNDRAAAGNTGVSPSAPRLKPNGPELKSPSEDATPKAPFQFTFLPHLNSLHAASIAPQPLRPAKVVKKPPTKGAKSSARKFTKKETPHQVHFLIFSAPAAPASQPAFPFLLQEPLP